MTYRIALCFALLVSATACAIGPQANIAIPCPERERILPGGAMQTVDCNGKPVGPSTKPDVMTAPPKTSAASSEVKLPADSPAAVAYQKYLEAYYNYQSHSLTYAESVFDWQYRASKDIFWVVILLVLSGLAFAGIQFAIAMRIPVRGTKKKGAAAGREPSTETPQIGDTSIEASTHGVKITSSVIGLLILVVSIGFFYLYLVYVYPIQNIGQ